MTSMKRSAGKLAALTLGAVLAFSGVANAETAGQYVDDSAITTKVKAALVGDSAVPSADITVNTTHGVVKLTGNVDTQAQYAAAAADAAKVDGVKSVDNMLRVHASQSPM